MVNIIGGKDHLGFYANEHSVGHPPSSSGTSHPWGYPGILKDFKLSHGALENTHTGIGSKWPQGWTLGGRAPELNITIEPSGSRFFGVLEPHLKDDLTENYISQAWELYNREGPTGVLGIGGIAKTLNLTKNGFSEPLSLGLGLVLKEIISYSSESGGLYSYKGFKDITTNHPEPEVRPWLGAHVEERITFGDGTVLVPTALRSWNMQVSRDIQTYIGPETGDDSNIYTHPRAISNEKMTATMSLIIGAQDWGLWERSRDMDKVSEVRLKFTRPAGVGSPSPSEFYIHLKNGVVKPFDLDIKELSALESPLSLEFSEVVLSTT